ncbi:MAG: PilN domain-containing protein [Deltaproteobacteria bacterium]|nr:PilN domain-containing protein [Deltaproteobacteria bacterium]
MIRINLLQTRETRALRRKHRTVMAGVAALCLAGMALAAVNIAQWRRQGALESGLAERRRVVAGLRLETAAVKELEERVRRQRQQDHAIKAWLQHRTRHPRVLRGLSAAAPEPLWLTRYAESQGTTILEGRATDDESIARFLRSLSRVFESRRLVDAGSANGEENLRRFVIHAEPGPPPNPVPPGGSGPGGTADPVMP